MLRHGILAIAILGLLSGAGPATLSLSVSRLDNNDDQVALVADECVPLARRVAIVEGVLAHRRDRETVTALLESIDSVLRDYVRDATTAKTNTVTTRGTLVAPTRQERLDSKTREESGRIIKARAHSAASKRQRERMRLLAPIVEHADVVLPLLESKEPLLDVLAGVVLAYEFIPPGTPRKAWNRLLRCDVPADVRAPYALRILDQFPTSPHGGYLEVFSKQHAPSLRKMVRAKLNRTGDEFPYEALRVLVHLGDHELMDELEAYVAKTQDKRRGSGKYVRRRLVEMHMARDPHWSLEFLREKTDLLGMIEPVLTKAKAEGVPPEQLKEAITEQIAAWSEKGSAQWKIKLAGIEAGILTEQDFPNVVEKKWFEDLTPAERQELEKILGRPIPPGK